MYLFTYLGVVNKLDRRRVLLTTRSTCRGKIFLVQSLGQSYREKCSYFWKYPNFLITQCGSCDRKPPCQKSGRFVQSFWYNTGLWQFTRELLNWLINNNCWLLKFVLTYYRYIHTGWVKKSKLHTFITSCLHKLARVYLAIISLTAFSHRIFKQKNNCEKNRKNVSPENIRQHFMFSVAALICSHSSYLLGFIDVFA